MNITSSSPEQAPGPRFTALGAERFVSLTTFRRSGDRVATTVWIAAFGDDLIVTTPAGSGKIKRLRNNPRVLLSAFGRFGKVPPGAVTVEATAQILGHDRCHPREKATVRRKYGLENVIVVTLEALARRRHRQSTERIILRISDRPIAA